MGLLIAESHVHCQGTYKYIELFEGRDCHSQHFPRIALTSQTHASYSMFDESASAQVNDYGGVGDRWLLDMDVTI